MNLPEAVWFCAYKLMQFWDSKVIISFQHDIHKVTLSVYAHSNKIETNYT